MVSHFQFEAFSIVRFPPRQKGQNESCGLQSFLSKPQKDPDLALLYMATYNNNVQFFSTIAGLCPGDYTDQQTQLNSSEVRRLNFMIYVTIPPSYYAIMFFYNNTCVFMMNNS